MVAIEDLDAPTRAAVEKTCTHIDGLATPDGSSLKIEALTGGITNRNYRLTGGSRDVVLRLHGKDTGLLGIDRRVEHAAACQAAALGIGPGVAGLIEPELYLVTEFVVADTADLASAPVFDAAVALLRTWHCAPAIPGRFDTFGLAENYARTATSRGVPLPAQLGRTLEISRSVEAVFASFDDPPVPGHNDLLGANFLCSTVEPGRVWLIDWEYAGMNSRWFDLGNFSVNNDFDAATDEALLERYFGGVSATLLARLTLMRVMSDIREAMWGVVQQGISALDFDYVGYANQHFDRMMMNASRPEFLTSLTIAGA